MTPPNGTAGFWIALWLVTNLLFVGIYDIAVRYDFVHGESVSYFLREWSKELPLLPVLIGILIGHLFFPSIKA